MPGAQGWAQQVWDHLSEQKKRTSEAAWAAGSSSSSEEPFRSLFPCKPSCHKQLQSKWAALCRAPAMCWQQAARARQEWGVLSADSFYKQFCSGSHCRRVSCILWHLPVPESLLLSQGFFWLMPAILSCPFYSPWLEWQRFCMTVYSGDRVTVWL